MTLTFEVTEQCDEQDRQLILDRLVSFNRSQAPDPDYRPLHILLRSGDELVGGLTGHTAWGWLGIELLYVPEQLRGQGAGIRLIGRAEAFARARDCHSALVDTHEFQALGFYQKLGYEKFGELPDYPPGFARYFLSKRLT